MTLLRPPPLYLWALDNRGQPTPIEQAKRDEVYVCPVCESRMIPRMGQVNQHHFGHVTVATNCSPDKVNGAASCRWLVMELRRAVAAHQSVRYQWSCRTCSQVHRADLLEGVARLAENVPHGKASADIGLLDANGGLCAAILIADGRRKTPQHLAAFANLPIPTLLVTLPATPADLANVIGAAQVVGGVCALFGIGSPFTRDPEAIRKALRGAVSGLEWDFCAPLEKVDGMPYVLHLKDGCLWLPPEVWREAVGGVRNPLAPDIQITIQTWPEADGGAIWLYYVVVRDTQAVAVRRFGPGQEANAALDYRFRHRAMTALELARQLVRQA